MKLIIPQFWRKKNFISSLLYPFSLIYSFISSKISHVEAKDIYHPKAKVITIGNITMGGAGKTPVALSIAKIVKNYSKHKVAILTRGYKGKLKGPVMVDSSHNVDDIGDEAILIFKEFTTCVAKNRLDGIKFLEENGYNIIITDDGMQDNRFQQSITIMVIDSYFGFGNGLILPAGPLREKIELGIHKADFIAIIGEGDFKLDTKVPILKAKIVSKTLLNQEKFIAFAGIGNPDKFFQSVIEAEGELVDKISFGDHYQYSDAEIRKLIDLSKSKNAKLITTEKDYTRIEDSLKDEIETLPIMLVWKEEEKLMERILAL